jgi:DNA gyrase/topoisomerase IV subunit A
LLGTPWYHPHGDASIGDAMVQIGQKNYWLIAKETGVIS